MLRPNVLDARGLNELAQRKEMKKGEKMMKDGIKKHFEIYKRATQRKKQKKERERMLKVEITNHGKKKPDQRKREINEGKLTKRQQRNKKYEYEK